MNINLENLIASKGSFEDENDIIKYAQILTLSNKNSSEVSIIKETNIDIQNKNISLFGIFDGHNGSEVSKYLSLHFSQFLSENMNFINGNYKKSLEETFINLDESFRSLQVQSELSKYSINKEQDMNINDSNKNYFNDFLEFFNPRNLKGVNIAEFCGSCGIVILITEKKAFIANAGNSKCVPLNIKNEIIQEKINREHTVNDEYEKERLNKIFGFREQDNTINNNYNKENFIDDFPLKITRGFGDLQYKDNKLINIEDQYISIKPDIIEIPIEDLNFLIIGNNCCFSNDNDILSLEKYFLDKYNKNCEQKISKIIGDFLDEKMKEVERKEENVINNFACIIIEVKHENNINNLSLDEEKEKINDKKDDSNINNQIGDEHENL